MIPSGNKYYLIKTNFREIFALAVDIILILNNVDTLKMYSYYNINVVNDSASLYTR